MHYVVRREKEAASKQTYTNSALRLFPLQDAAELKSRYKNLSYHTEFILPTNHRTTHTSYELVSPVDRHHLSCMYHDKPNFLPPTHQQHISQATDWFLFVTMMMLTTTIITPCRHNRLRHNQHMTGLQTRIHHIKGFGNRSSICPCDRTQLVWIHGVLFV